MWAMGNQGPIASILSLDKNKRLHDNCVHTHVHVHFLTQEVFRLIAPKIIIPLSMLHALKLYNGFGRVHLHILQVLDVMLYCTTLDVRDVLLNSWKPPMTSIVSSSITTLAY